MQCSTASNLSIAMYNDGKSYGDDNEYSHCSQ